MLWWPFGTRQRPPGGSRKPTVPCGKLKLSTFIGFWFPHATVAFGDPPAAAWMVKKPRRAKRETKNLNILRFLVSACYGGLLGPAKGRLEAPETHDIMRKTKTTTVLQVSGFRLLLWPLGTRKMLIWRPKMYLYI